jgi:hypothetical protein
MDIFYDPGYQPRPALPVLQRSKLVQPDPPYPLDREIVNFLRGQPQATPIWTMANAVAAALNPANRAERRALTTEILSRITPLVYARLVKRVGRNFLALG